MYSDKVVVRTKNGLYKYIKSLDENSPISKRYISYLVDSGIIPHIKVGNRKLINVGKFLDYINNPANEVEDVIPASKIQKVY